MKDWTDDDVGMRDEYNYLHNGDWETRMKEDEERDKIDWFFLLYKTLLLLLPREVAGILKYLGIWKENFIETRRKQNIGRNENLCIHKILADLKNLGASKILADLKNLGARKILADLKNLGVYKILADL
jgi:hypothetical protein